MITIAQRMDIPVKESRFTRDEMYIADEMFFTGTAAEVTPVRSVDHVPVGSGSRGPITQQIQEVYFGVVKGQNERYQHWLTYI